MNSKTRLLVLLIMCWLVPSALQAQDCITAFNRDVIEPAPQSAQLRKYDSPQPDLATGAVNVSIPLFDIKYRGLTIPFELNYTTSGIKVFDVSFPYGLGWTLMPGLRVSRTILGRRDEGFQQGDFSNYQNAGYNLMAYAMRDEYVLPNEAQNYVDTQHDIYTMHLLGDSHSFVLEESGDTLRVLSGQPAAYRIDPNQRYSAFLVTDGNGNRYSFGRAQEGRGFRYITGWMLDTIRFPNNEAIIFEWEQMRSTPEYYYDSFTIDDCHDVYGSLTSSNEGWAEAEGDNIQVLKKITYPLGTVDFDYSGQANSYLTDITVRNLSNDTIERIHLAYDSVDLRTRLLDHVDVRRDGTYQMTYNRTHISNFYAQDWWGFYNGKNNARLFPDMKIRVNDYYLGANQFSPVNSSSYVDTQGGDRSVDVDCMKANILTRIDYPTGGWSQFEYEPHQFTQPDLSTPRINRGANTTMTVGGGLRVKKITTHPGNGYNDLINEYKYGLGENGLAEVIAFPSPSSFVDQYFSFNYYETELDHTLEIYKYRHLTIGSFSNYMRWHIGESPIWYKEVAVYCKNGAKQVYDFGRLQSNWITTRWGGDLPNTLNAIFSKGVLMLKKQDYERNDGSSYNLASESQNDYYEINGELENSLTDLAIERNIASYASGQIFAPDVWFNDDFIYTDYWPYQYHEEDVYISSPYQLSLKSEALRTVINKEFLANGILESKQFTNYTKYGLPSQKFSIRFNDTIKTMYVYPFQQDLSRNELQQAMANLLTERFQVSTPMKTIRDIDGQTETSLVEYNTFYGQCLPWRELLIKGEDTCVVHEMDYDAWGNIISLTTLDDLDETFIWDSNGKYPLFHIVGINYNDLQQLQGFPPASLRDTTQLAATHAWLVQTLPRDCIVEAFQHEPLVGRKVSMDGNGHVTRYEYDTYGRLIEVSRDGYGVLNKYRYHRFDEP